MRINWKIRLMNKAFWTAIVPAVLLAAQVVLDVFGVEMDFGELGNKLLQVVNAVFAVLTVLGVVTDPTTQGVEDSDRAMNYTEPGK